MARVVLDLDVVGDGVAGLVGAEFVRPDAHVEQLLAHRDLQVGVADLELWERAIRSGTLDQHHGDIDVGRVVGFDGQPDRLAVALQLQALHPTDRAALNSQQGLAILEGRGDQDFGHIARLIGLLVGDQLDAVVVLLSPVDELPAADPDVRGAANLVAGFISSFGHDAVHTALLRREPGLRVAVLVRGDLGLADQGVGV